MGTGCSNLAGASREIITNEVYACTGTWSGGGVYGSEAAGLCLSGFHICESANELEIRGLTADMCANNVAQNLNEFFATKETSEGWWQCYSKRTDDISGKQGVVFNDIWGCSMTGSSAANNPDCGVLNSAVGNGNWNGWILTGNGADEAISYALNDAQYGGVLCCRDSYDAWTLGLTLGPNNNEYNERGVDIGEAAFNEIFQNSYHHIIKSECPHCADTHKVIYYRRLMNPTQFTPYSYLKDWFSNNNNMDNGDFMLTSTLKDAIDGTNAWSSCNYDDPTIGAFRDCGPSGLIGGQWSGNGKGQTARFSIYMDFPVVLTLGGTDNSYNGQSVDYGKDAFNQIFQNSDYHIIRRECSSCDDDFKDIYYRRLKNPTSFDAYSYMKSWMSDNNEMDKGDFILTSTLESAISRTSVWNFCNYNDPPVGAFRDCGKGSAVGGQWTGDRRGKSVRFSIYTGVSCPVEQIGKLNADIPGCGMESCDARYGLDTIQDCSLKCKRSLSCIGYNWAPLGGDKNHVEGTVCTLYDSFVPTSIWGPHQVFCGDLTVFAVAFAPLLKFDSAASSYGYPMNPQVFVDNGNTGENTVLDTTSNPTFYRATTCGSAIKISYYWWYGHQHSCGVSGTDHKWDWEKVTVKIENSEVSQVTYHQHTGWYTAPRADISFYGDHPVVYVGKIGHGSYYDSNNYMGGCGYYYDYRDPDSEADWLHTWDNLINRDFNTEPWIQDWDSNPVDDDYDNVRCCRGNNPLTITPDEVCADDGCDEEEVAGCSWRDCDTTQELITDWEQKCSLQDRILKIWAQAEAWIEDEAIPWIGDFAEDVGDQYNEAVRYVEKAGKTAEKETKDALDQVGGFFSSLFAKKEPNNINFEDYSEPILDYNERMRVSVNVVYIFGAAIVLLLVNVVMMVYFKCKGRKSKYRYKQVKVVDSEVSSSDIDNERKVLDPPNIN